MTLLYLVSGILVLTSLWLGWRYLALRRGLHNLTRQLQQLDEAIETPPTLSDLARALNEQRSTFNHQLSSAHAEHSRLSAILDQLSDGVLIADAEGFVRFSNPAAGKLFGGVLEGYSVVEAVRQHQLAEAWRRCRDTGQPQSESVELPATHHFVQLIIVPDRDTPGGTLLLAQDLTRVRRLETVRRDFVSNLSHELRTPLASLKALTETLQDGALADPEAGPRFLGRIHTEVDALTQMAQELLDLSKIESSQVALNLQPILPMDLLHASADRMRVQAERARVRLTVETSAGPVFQGDAARLEQVLVNLIHNAVKFTKPGGSVTLSAKETGKAIVFAVKDTGVGIPAENLSRIFERFYRVEKSRAGSGTGLGLSIAKHIVEAHGGNIRAESREGEGSTFHFEIPLS